MILSLRGSRKTFSFLIPLFTALSFASSHAKAFVNDTTSWSLRFESPQSINVARTGCYGTASYGYVLPTVEYVQAYRSSLQALSTQHGLSGFTFTREADVSGNPAVVDLRSGRVSYIPAGLNASYKGVVFCQCRQDLTHSTYGNGAPNCAHSDILPPLGVTFIANKDGTASGPSTEWTDPVTGWQWQFAAVASNWYTARTICTGEFILPDLSIIAHAIHRLWNSQIGQRIVQANADRVWSSEEFDWFSAMAVYIPSGNAGSVNKTELFPVLCVKQN